MIFLSWVVLKFFISILLCFIILNLEFNNMTEEAGLKLFSINICFLIVFSFVSIKVELVRNGSYPFCFKIQNSIACDFNGVS